MAMLNTSWFLPQNRERIYLVGYSTETKRDWRGVFPIATNNGQTNESYRKGEGCFITDKRGNRRDSNTASTLCAGYHKLPSDGDYVGVKQLGTRLDSGGKQPYQQDRVYDADGIVPALNQGKSDLILKVNSATSDGYEQADVGDSINLSNPNSETRRGRVGKQKAQTLETSCNQAVVESYRIRRLTPIECERLQGFPDDHTAFGNYDGEVKSMSNTQRYKQCGNAVTVDVVKAVAERCKPLFK